MQAGQVYRWKLVEASTMKWLHLGFNQSGCVMGLYSRDQAYLNDIPRLTDNIVISAANRSVLGPALLGPALLGPALLGPALLGPALLGPAGLSYALQLLRMLSQHLLSAMVCQTAQSKAGQPCHHLYSSIRDMLDLLHLPSAPASHQPDLAQPLIQVLSGAWKS